MILSEELKQAGVIKRAGELKTIVLPKGKVKPTNSYEISVNVEDESLSFVDGDSIFAIYDHIGIKEESEFTIFLANKYLVVELHWGKLYFKGENGVIFSVNDGGNIEYPKASSSQINWLDESRVRTYLNYMVKSKYNLTNDDEVRRYINNLAFTVVSATEQTKSKIENIDTAMLSFRFKVKEYYSDLGLDKFDYAVKEAVKVKVSEYVYEEDYEKAEKADKEAKKSELQAEAEYRRLRDGEDIVLNEPELDELGFIEEDEDTITNLED